MIRGCSLHFSHWMQHGNAKHSTHPFGLSMVLWKWLNMGMASKKNVGPCGQFSGSAGTLIYTILLSRPDPTIFRWGETWATGQFFRVWNRLQTFDPGHGLGFYIYFCCWGQYSARRHPLPLCFCALKIARWTAHLAMHLVWIICENVATWNLSKNMSKKSAWLAKPTCKSPHLDGF